MTRNLKALGLALVAAFSMSAVMASAASAEHELEFLVTGGGTAILDGKDEPTFQNTFKTTAGTTHCTEATYSGESASGVTSIEASAVYGGCEVTPIGHAEVHMNGCKYKFHAGSTVNGKMEGSVDIVCPLNKEITVTATVFGTVKCTIHIPPQTGLKEITYTNIGSGATDEITVDINITKIKYTHTAGTGFGACSGGSAEDGTFEGKALVTGTNASKEHVGVAVTDTKHP